MLAEVLPGNHALGLGDFSSLLDNLCALPSPFPPQGLKKITDINRLMCIVTQREFGIDAIPDTPALSFFADVAGSVQIGDYLAHCPFGDAYCHGELSGGDPRLLGNRAKHEGMIGEKRPLWHGTKIPPKNFRIVSKDLLTTSEISDIVNH